MGAPTNRAGRSALPVGAETDAGRPRAEPLANVAATRFLLLSPAFARLETSDAGHITAEKRQTPRLLRRGRGVVRVQCFRAMVPVTSSRRTPSAPRPHSG